MENKERKPIAHQLNQSIMHNKDPPVNHF